MRIIRSILLISIIICPFADAASSCGNAIRECQTSTIEFSDVNSILNRLNRSTENLQTYQCNIEYLYSQPLFESSTLRTGNLFYQRRNKTSNLRLDFLTLKQDQEKQVSNIEQYFFDGVWLTFIDHPNKQAQKRQLTDTDKPKDAFELMRENFPVIGFAPSEDLRRDFDITLANDKAKDANAIIVLKMKVKPDSIFKDDYSTIDFLIDPNNMLPYQITAESIEGDIYLIKFTDVKVNQKLPKKVFEVKIPDDFPKPQIINIEKDRKRND